MPHNIDSLINNHINNLHYTSVSSTLKQKFFIYQAFLNLNKKYPKEFYEYLHSSKRGYSMLSKIFQEYVRVLEGSFPFSYIKNKKPLIADSISNKDFNPFSGESEFISNIKDNIIKNETKEYYIGSRESYYCKPFYIGKLISIINLNDNRSLLNDVEEYTFNFIKINHKNAPVKVKHLRIPAHYQMGILSHINRIKKKISTELNTNH